MTLAVERIVDLADGQTALAQKINDITGATLTQSNISAWLRDKAVPAHFIPTAKEIAGGELSVSDFLGDHVNRWKTNLAVREKSKNPSRRKQA